MRLMPIEVVQYDDANVVIRKTVVGYINPHDVSAVLPHTQIGVSLIVLKVGTTPIMHTVTTPFKEVMDAVNQAKADMETNSQGITPSQN